ncbi:hypothetical protein ACP275_09G010000 [Erythranthe tilingii]
MARVSHSILLSFFLMVLAEASYSGGEVVVWPIWNLNDSKTAFVAKFAVAQHNKKTNTTLRFVTIVDGDYERLANVKWSYSVQLTFFAKDNKIARPKKYEASVLYTPPLKYPNSAMELNKFLKNPGVLAANYVSWIKDLKDSKVVWIAEFAVAEYNKKANTTLQFVRVLNGKTYLVAGLIYHLLISIKDESDAHPKTYETAVLDIPWEIKGGYKLDSFKLFKSIWT